jgi:hypothetical protein
MLLGNAFTHDFRPLKQGRSLVAAGADVRVVATAAPGLPERDIVDGVRVVRASHDPLPSRLIRAAVAHRRGAGTGEPVVLAPRAAPAGGLAARVHAAELARVVKQGTVRESLPRSAASTSAGRTPSGRSRSGPPPGGSGRAG